MAGTIDDILQAALDAAARQLEAVLLDAAAAVADPDYWGAWQEVYLGNPLLPRQVMVDVVGNVVHAARQGEDFDDEQLTITYLPAWLYASLKWRLRPGAGAPPADVAPPAAPPSTDPAVARTSATGAGGALSRTGAPAAPAVPPSEGGGAPAGPRDDEVVAIRAVDIADALPLKVTTEIVHRIARSGEDPTLPPRIPRVVYDVEPGAAAVVLGKPYSPKGSFAPTTTNAKDRVHLPAPSLRIIAAPGVRVRAAPLLGTGVLWDASPSLELLRTAAWGEVALYAARRAAEAASRNAPPEITSAQALRLEIERRQDLELLPALGSPRRRSGCAEVDLLAATISGAQAQFQEFSRPDGVDVVLLTPAAAAALGKDPTFSQLVAGVVGGGLTYLQGTIDPAEPIPVRIRVDPESAEDRYAYSLCLLDRPAEASDPSRVHGEVALRPWFRLVVERTGSVLVFADQRFSADGRALLSGVVEYWERVVEDLDQVSPALDPALCAGGEEDLAAAGFRRLSGGIRPRPWTATEVLDLVLTGIGLIPHPAAQFAANLYDYATVVSYLTLGTDPVGREMSRGQFAMTAGGLLVPHVVEKVVANAPALRRLLRSGDETGSRLQRVLESAAPDELTTDLAAIGAPP